MKFDRQLYKQEAKDYLKVKYVPALIVTTIFALASGFLIGTIPEESIESFFASHKLTDYFLYALLVVMSEPPPPK